jgi:hypothetical protein
MRILIVDDSKLWLEYGRKLLKGAGYEVTAIQIMDSRAFTSESLPEPMMDALRNTDVLLIDKDFSGGITSGPMVCVVRHNFPELPIIRWSGGHDRGIEMEALNVNLIEKPNRKTEGKFIEVFDRALRKQRIRLASGPMGIFRIIQEAGEFDDPDNKKWEADNRRSRLQQIGEIARLADTDSVPYGDYMFTIRGRGAGTTMHELGHCICDGALTADEIRPHLPKLQRVIAKLETAGEIDDRFRICADFIKTGNLEELDLVRRCY